MITHFSLSVRFSKGSATWRWIVEGAWLGIHKKDLSIFRNIPKRLEETSRELEYAKFFPPVLFQNFLILPDKYAKIAPSLAKIWEWRMFYPSNLNKLSVCAIPPQIQTHSSSFVKTLARLNSANFTDRVFFRVNSTQAQKYFPQVSLVVKFHVWTATNGRRWWLGFVVPTINT